MSWLSDRTGIHIGWGPPKVSNTPPPEVQAKIDAIPDPAMRKKALEDWQTLGQITDSARGMNNTAAKIGAAAVGASALGAAGGAAGGGGVLDFLKNYGPDAISFLKSNAGKALDLGLGTAGMINAANLQGQSSDYAKQAGASAHQSYDERQPLRLAGVQGMLNPKLSSDVSNLGAGSRAANPFARKGPLPLPVQPPPGTG